MQSTSYWHRPNLSGLPYESHVRLNMSTFVANYLDQIVLLGEFVRAVLPVTVGLYEIGLVFAIAS